MCFIAEENFAPVASNLFIILPNFSDGCKARYVAVAESPFSSMLDFQLKRKKKKKLVSQLSLTDVEFQSHNFEITKWIALYYRLWINVGHTFFKSCKTVETPSSIRRMLSEECLFVRTIDLRL